MGTIRKFEDLEAWRRSRELVNAVYLLCSNGSLKRDFAIRDQITRAALSVMTNVAEGFGRRTHADFARFLDMARASGIEAQSLLYAVLDIHRLPSEEFQRIYDLADETIAIIAGLQHYLRNRS